MKDVATRKCKASGLKNKLIIGSFFRFPRVDCPFELETEKGRDRRQETTAGSIQVTQPGERAPIFVGVHLYLPMDRVTCRKKKKRSM